MSNEIKHFSELYIKEIIKYYEYSRKVLTREDGMEVYRGRSRSISSETEDFTAIMLFKILREVDDTISIYIDQCISLKKKTTTEKTKTFYPDIMICIGEQSDKKCVYMCDLKMDPGWNRKGLPKLTKNHIEQLKKVKDNVYEKKTKSGISKETFMLNFSSCNFYDTVYISEKNGSKQFTEDYIKLKNKNKESKPFVLFDGPHPNSYQDVKKKDVQKIVSKDFDEWIDRIKYCIEIAKEKN